MSCHRMPPVAKCDVEKCFYNHDMQCHAPAINIGGELHPRCDSFVPCVDHIGCTGTSEVGACHTSLCKFNTDLTCAAAEIAVGFHVEHADCKTFEAR